MEPEEHSVSSSRDAKINEIIASYLDAIQEGNPAAKTEWLQKYPQFVSELSSFFTDLEAAEAVVSPTQPLGTIQTSQVVSQLGNYELLEKIGQGGMGAVFKARQVNLNRLVALKLVLAGELASEADVERFRREAESAAQLQHPGIVRIHEVGEQEGQHFFSMDLVEGTDLAAVIRERSLSPEEAVGYLLRTTEAVQYAHEQGVIHRDLKPANTLIDRANEPRITDFGLAKRIEEDSDLTESGAVLGTPSYMSPEQALGQQAEKTSDIYALGAILYEMLTARPPFKADSPVEMILQVRDNEPVPPRQMNPRIPVDLETICLKCLEKDSQRRYQTVQSLHDDLLCYQRGEPILARPISRLGRATRWCRRKPAIAALAAILACITIISPPIAIHQLSLQGEVDQANNRAAEMERELVALEERPTLPEDFEFRVLTSVRDTTDLISLFRLIKFKYTLSVGRDRASFHAGRDVIQGLNSQGLAIRQDNRGDILSGNFEMRLLWNPEPFACFRDGKALGIWVPGVGFRAAAPGEADQMVSDFVKNSRQRKDTETAIPRKE
jgi:serine/threonine protein kinase